MSWLSVRFDWPSALLIIAAIGAGFFAFRRGRDWLALLRVAAWAVLVWLALEPSTASVPHFSGKPALAVMVDVSRSMGIEDPEERLKSAQRLLKSAGPALEEQFDVFYYQFSQASAVSSLKEILRARPQGATTDVAESVRQALSELKNEHPAVLLFTDGAHPEEAGAFPPMDSPLFPVGMGSSGDLKDVVIADVRGADFAFKNRPVDIVVKVRGAGFQGRSVPVVLSERGADGYRRISSKEVMFPAAPQEAEALFRMVPPAVGVQDLRVEVPPQPGEAAKTNNTVDFQMEVQREKIRVLYLCGQPSPEYAFLRQVLKSDPSVDLVSFVILRNPENVVPVPEEQLSLIPFPTNDIFVTTLPDFDLLVFENFSYSRFGISMAHLENIRRFVETMGGAFLMTGGESSFGRGGYPGTPIESILPVEMNSATEGVEEGDYTLRVLEPRHPVMSLGESLAETERLWKDLPPVRGMHRLPKAKAGASVLALFRESGTPAVVCWQRGKGRVMAAATVSTWQWALGLSERGLLQSTYTQFWRQAVRWLITSSDQKAVRVVLNQPRWTAGRKGTVKVVIQPDRMKSSGDPQVELTVSDGGGAPKFLPLTASGKFEYRSDWAPAEAGEYRFVASMRDGARTFTDVRVVPVRAVDWEMENPYPNHAYLQSLASKSGGEYFNAQDFSAEKLKGKVKAARKSTTETAQKALWTSPWFFVLAAGLLLTEWGIRRWRGGL